MLYDCCVKAAQVRDTCSSLCLLDARVQVDQVGHCVPKPAAREPKVLVLAAERKSTSCVCVCYLCVCVSSLCVYGIVCVSVCHLCVIVISMCVWGCVYMQECLR